MRIPLWIYFFFQNFPLQFISKALALVCSFGYCCVIAYTKFIHLLSTSVFSVAHTLNLTITQLLLLAQVWSLVFHINWWFLLVFASLIYFFFFFHLIPAKLFDSSLGFSISNGFTRLTNKSYTYSTQTHFCSHRSRLSWGVCLYVWLFIPYRW